MKVEMSRVDDSSCFMIPGKNDTIGVRINEVVIDDNKLPKSRYTMVGPRKVNISLPIPIATKVFAEIEQL